MNRQQRRAREKATERSPGNPRLRSLFERAVGCQSQGQLADAEQLCAQIIAADPCHAEAMNLAGVLASQTGQQELALQRLRAAIALAPRAADYHANLSIVLRGIGRQDEAMAENRTAIELNPGHVNAIANLSQLQLDAGDPEGAAKSARRALALERDHVGALVNLGIALSRMAEALEDADDPRRLTMLTEAVQMLRRAVALRPHAADAHSNLGAALRKLDRLDEAGQALRRAIELDPRRADAHNNLGTVLWAQDLRPEAIALHRQAIALDPGCADARYNLGSALLKCGDFAAASEELERALAIAPAASHMHTALAFALLAQGRLEVGFREFEWRWKEEKVGQPRRPLPQPWWEGEDLSAQSIVAWGEQGVGDELQYSAIVPDLAARAGHVVLECERRLVPLFARSFPGVEVVARQDPVAPRLLDRDLRWQTPLGHTFQWLRPTMASFPAAGGHLRADVGRVAFWRSRLADLGEGLKVGIAWRSRNLTQYRLHHYSSLEQWGEVFRVPGVRFVNLQYDECRAELQAATERFGVTLHTWPDIDLMQDLDDVAALTLALDLVISPDTAVAMMAGGLGAPTWQLTPEHLVWETLGTDRMAFLPSVTIVNRPWAASWDSVLAEVAIKLRARVGAG